MSDKIQNSATESTKGIVHQFYVALDKCFELEAGESVYIEYYGDVSIPGKSQIEVKKYKKSLTNLDHNFWNTLKNWMDSSFPEEKFKDLILCTTQKISSQSIFNYWNENNLDKRLKNIQDVYEKFLKRKTKDERTSDLLNYIFDETRREKLSAILSKIIIQSSQKHYQNFHNKIRDQYSKGIPKSSRDRFIYGLLGFIISPNISMDYGWEISYDVFAKEVEELTLSLKEGSVIFPQKIELKNIDNSMYQDSIFVKKIEKIKYNEVIPDAISDYIHTNIITLNEMRSSVKHQELERYKGEINDDYIIKFRKAQRNTPQNGVINSSKDFYDDFTGKDPTTFFTYNSVPSYFRRGLIHNLANDIENYKIEWRLKNE